MIETTTITAPAYWASYLINNDATGLTKAEQAACDRWCQQKGPWRIVSTRDQAEPYFTWSFQDYGGSEKGGEVLDYVAHMDVALEGEPK